MNNSEDVEVAYLPEDNINKRVIIPINAAIKIFTFLTRDDIENCKLVCRGWKQLIDFADKELPKRSIDALVLSSNHEYTITIYHSYFKRVFCYRKYFYDRDIDEMEYKNTHKMQDKFNVKTFKFPCGELLPCVSDNMNFALPDSGHHIICRNLPYDRFIFFHNGSRYTRKLFTPPLGFYERLKKMLHNGYVKRLIFQSFTFTDLFVEKFIEYLNGPFKHMDAVYIHFCSFRQVSSVSFHNLLDFLSSKQYFIERSTNCLPSHVNRQLLDKRSIKMAEVFSFGNAFARHRQLRDDLFLIDDEAFFNFVNSLSAFPHVTRKFFGIAQCRVTPEFKRRYEKLIEQVQQNNLTNTNLSFHKNSNWLFKYVIFKDLIHKIDF